MDGDAWEIFFAPSTGKRGVISEHDVKLTVDGNWESDQEREKYIRQLCETLNRAALSAHLEQK